MLPAWRRRSVPRTLDGARQEHTRVWTDPATMLDVHCVAVTCADFPAVEWTVYLRNTGTEVTPVLEDSQGLDLRRFAGYHAPTPRGFREAVRS